MDLNSLSLDDTPIDAGEELNTLHVISSADKEDDGNVLENDSFSSVPLNLTPKQQKAEEQYQKYKAMAANKDYSSIEELNILRLAGVDKLGRPIAILEAVNLPAKTVDLKLLLLYFISVMDPIVNNDYALVFIATKATSDNRPPVEWLSTAYSMFNRKYKKNLKALYIIHPSRLVKLTLALVKPFISAKFWKKVVSIEDINHVYRSIDRDQITFPNYVIRYNAKYSAPKPIFGTSLSSVLETERNPDGIPQVLQDCIEYLQDYMNVEGLFRQSGESAKINKIAKAYNFGEKVDFDDADVHTVAGVLKKFLRDLADPLFPFEYYEVIIQFNRMFSKDYESLWIEKTNSIVSNFPTANVRTMKTLFPFLHEVSKYSSENRMTASNLGTVLGPSIVRSEGIPSDMSELLEANVVIEKFILHHEKLLSTKEEESEEE